MIDETIKLSNTVDTQTLTQILSRIHSNAVGIQYAIAVPDTLPDGKFVVVDNGTDLPTLYIKTGIGRIAWVELTV